MVEHTPGPWSIATRQTFTGPVADHVFSGHGRIANVAPEDNIEFAIRTSNARLIAAAPDMKAAILAWKKADAANRVGPDAHRIVAELYEEAHRLRAIAVKKLLGSASPVSDHQS